MKRWIRSILLLGVFTSVPLLGSAPYPSRSFADDPAPRTGDLVVQFGQLEYNCGDGCSIAGEPSDRIEFIEPRFGGLVTHWETGFDDVRGMDASNGDGVLLAIPPTPAIGDVNNYAVRLAAEDGTVDETWGVESPGEVWADGIVETPEDGDPVVGEYDLLEAVTATTFIELDVSLLYTNPRALGASPGTVVYATGESTISPGRQIRLANRSTGSLIETVPITNFKDGHMTPDAHGVVLTPGVTTTAQYVSFDGRPRDVEYDIPWEEALCDPVAVDAGGDRVYVLTVCAEEHGAQIHEFERTSGRWLGIVKTWSAETLSNLDAYPLRMRIYGSFAPTETKVIYVHGGTKSAGLESHLRPLRESIELNYSAFASFNHFHYWQDIHTCEEGVDPEASFGPFEVLPTLEPTTGDDMPVDGHAGGSWDDPCDSESAIAENVLLLHDAIKDAYFETGRPVILIGVSMGAAIIRGVLTYSTLLDDDVASTMIDSVIFIAGAHDGSPDAACATGACGAVPDLQLIYMLLTDLAWDLGRPAIHDLSTNSPWYDWANDARAPLPADVGYYNFFADIDAQKCRVRTIGYCWGGLDTIPVGQWGDGILNPGTGYPYDTPNEGGAKFFRPDTIEQWEYQIYGPNGNKVRENASDVKHEKARNYDAYHARIVWHTASLGVDSCDGGRTTLAQQLEFIVMAQLGLGLGPDGARACPLHEGATP